MLTSDDRLRLAAGNAFDPIRPDFAELHVDITQSFRWGLALEQLGVLPEEHAVAFGFHGNQLEGINEAEAERLDYEILCGADESGGLLAYKSFRNVRLHRVTLNICTWKNMAALKKGTGSDVHAEAIERAPEFYESYRVECWDIARRAVGEQVDAVKIYEHRWPEASAV